MRKILNVAEKPSIAKHLAQAISNNSTRNLPSLSQYNPIYSFQGQFLQEPAVITVTSVTGHIQEIAFPEQYKKWEAFDPGLLLSEAPIYIRDSEDKTKVIQNLENLAKSHTDLFLWLDCDREGEAIAYEVIGICNRTNKNLRIFRAKFSSVAKDELLKAFQSPVEPNPALNDAVLVRQELDLRSGACFTRLQTLLIRRHFPKASPNGIASYGPCQFPTLHFVVERYLSHIAFQNTKFWTLNLFLEKDKIQFDLIWDRQKLFDKFSAALIYEIEMERPLPKVEAIQKRNQKRFKPLPLTTVDLQKLAVSKLKMTSDQAMKVAEKLYTQGFISYPRTETNAFPNGFDFKRPICNLQQHPEYADFGDELMNKGKFDKPRMGKRDDKAHPPIHPTKLFDGNPNSDEFRLFDLIARHFLASCAEDAVTEVIELHVRLNQEFFHTSGVQILEKNFLKIYEKFYFLKEKVLPPLSEGEQLTLKEFNFKEGVTSPPKLLSESDLITLMDRHGIGTDATIHEHIKTIQERKYALKVKGLFKPTQLGIAILGAYKKINLSLGNPENRAETEKNLHLVAEGQLSKEQCTANALAELQQAYKQLNENVGNFLKHFKEIFEQFYSLSNIELEADLPVGENKDFVDFVQRNQVNLSPCNCGEGVLQVRLSKKGRFFVGCTNYPRCTNSFFFKLHFKTVKNSEQICLNCNVPMITAKTETSQQEERHYCIRPNCPDSIFEYLEPSKNNFSAENSNRARSPDSNPGIKFRPRQFIENEEMLRENARQLEEEYGENQRQRNGFGTSRSVDKKVLRCFRCQKEGHIAPKCPELRQQTERSAKKAKKPKK